jgi:hypothetical protein
MRVCYVDESGDTQALATSTDPITPVCVVAGVTFDQSVLQHLTQEFLSLKRATHPRLRPTGSTRLSWMLAEIKGADLRKALRTGAPRRNRRHAINFLDKFVTLLEDFEAQVFGRVWIKAPGAACDGRAIHTFSMQAICTDFQQLLESRDDAGIVIADSNHATNVAVSHSIFTQKFKLDGDQYARILEMPMFGHSENHAGIQVADLVCSALVFPMATYSFCRGHVDNVHVDDEFGQLVERYGSRLKKLQFRYTHNDGRRRGGFMVDDDISHLPGSRLFATS